MHNNELLDKDDGLDLNYVKLVVTVMAMWQEDKGGGICTECHETTYGVEIDGESYPVEPDAEGYECESCGALAVCGAEQWVLMNVA